MADFCRAYDPFMWEADPLRNVSILCEGHARFEDLDESGFPIDPPPEWSAFGRIDIATEDPVEPTVDAGLVAWILLWFAAFVGTVLFYLVFFGK